MYYLALKIHFVLTFFAEYWARICKRLWSPGIDSENSIPPAYVAWRAGTICRAVVPTCQAGNRFLGSLKGLKYRLSRIDSFTPIHIYKPIHTNIDTLVQAYIYRLIQSYIDTHLALNIHFVPKFFADCSRINSYTLIHIFKPIHRHIDTPVHQYTSIYCNYRLIHSYIDTRI
jgi:hypothetical protein